MTTAAFLATTSRDDILAQWWIDIAGIRRRYGTCTPSWSPADTGTNRPIRPWLTDIPDITGPKAEPLNGTCEPSRFEVNILDVDGEITSLLSVNKQGNITHLAEAIPASTSGLSEDYDVEDGSVFSADTDIYIGSETLRLTAIAGNTLTLTRGMYGSEASVHNITNSSGYDVSVLVSDRPTFMLTRSVVLYECRDGLSESDAIKINGFLSSHAEDDGVWTLTCEGWLGRVKKTIGENIAKTIIGSPKDEPVWLWGGFNEVYIRDMIAFNNRGVAFEKGAPTDGILYNTTAFTRHIAWSNIISCAADAEGTAAFLKFPDAEPTSKKTIAIGDEILRYEHKEAETYLFSDGYKYNLLHVSKDSYADTGSGIEYWKIAGSDNRGLISQLLGEKKYCEFHIPYSSGLIVNKDTVTHYNGDEIRRILGTDDFSAGTDPVSVFLQFLCSIDGDGTNGDYDTLPNGWGLGIDQTMIDVDACLIIRNYVAGVEYSGSTGGIFLAEPTDAMEYLAEAILRPAMLFPIETPDGKISLSMLYPKDYAERMESLATINNSDLLSEPVLTIDKAPIATVTIKCNWHPIRDEYRGEVMLVFGDSLINYKGTARNIEIEAKTLYWGDTLDKRTTIFSNMYVPSQISRLTSSLFSRFADNPCPEITCEVAYNRLADYKLGDVVMLTCSNTPNPKTGSRGFAGEYCQIIGISPNPTESSLTLTLWLIDIHSVSYRRLAPAATVKSYDGLPASPLSMVVVNQHDYTNTPGTGHYDADCTAFGVGDKVVVLDKYFVPITGSYATSVLTIAGVGDGTDGDGNNYIIFTTTPGTDPEATDIIVPAKWDDCISTQQEEFSWLADSSDKLGSGNDDPQKRF